MIIVTGGAGFIGSALVWKFNQKHTKELLVVDQLGHGPKWKNLVKREILDIIHKDHFLSWLDQRPKNHDIDAVFHMGACSSTTETNVDYLIENNLHYSMKLWQFCAKNKIPFIYASSAATYGRGEYGYVDNPKLMSNLRPINPYGYSKQLFDSWVLSQKSAPPFWAGLKFFNVYGPQEYHKEGQASVVLHAFPQVRDSGILRLFKSYHTDIKHGCQRRDFVYIKDVVDVLYHLFQVRRVAVNGIYNLGSGKARTFVDLGKTVFKATEQGRERFEWIEMPEQLKAQYQYFTEADLTLLRQKTGYKTKMTSIEDGVSDYIKNYLATNDPYL
ncbi:MAG: ADP-glyceromanno-heptose 6-epimerase [Proteobacteria bacterium]|nr:ADP-glyceromanno-heptose 6-epimerase [Pseudomonadota bacterium]